MRTGILTPDEDRQLHDALTAQLLADHKRQQAADAAGRLSTPVNEVLPAVESVVVATVPATVVTVTNSATVSDKSDAKPWYSVFIKVQSWVSNSVSNSVRRAISFCTSTETKRIRLEMLQIRQELDIAKRYLEAHHLAIASLHSNLIAVVQQFGKE